MASSLAGTAMEEAEDLPRVEEEQALPSPEAQDDDDVPSESSADEALYDEVPKAFPCTVRRGAYYYGYQGHVYVCRHHLCFSYRQWSKGDSRNVVVPYQVIHDCYPTTIKGLPLKLKVMFKEPNGNESWYSFSFWTQRNRNLMMELLNVQRKLHGSLNTSLPLPGLPSLKSVQGSTGPDTPQLPFDLIQACSAPPIGDDWAPTRDVELQATPQQVFALALCDTSNRTVKFMEDQGMTNVKMDGPWTRDPEGEPAYVRAGRFYHPKNGVHCTQHYRLSVYEGDHMVLDVHQQLQGKPGVQFIHIFRRWDFMPLRSAEGGKPKLLFRAHMKIEFDKSRLAGFLPKDMIRSQTKADMQASHDAFIKALNDWLLEAPQPESLASRVLSKSATLGKLMSRLISSTSERPPGVMVTAAVAASGDANVKAVAVQGGGMYPGGMLWWVVQLVMGVLIAAVVLHVQKHAWWARMQQLEVQIEQLSRALEAAQQGLR